MKNNIFNIKNNNSPIPKCQKCGEDAVIFVSHQGRWLCRKHFNSYFFQKLEKIIKHYKLFTKKDKLFLAVSGGKDSMSLWDALYHIGYKPIGYYIKLGLGPHEDKIIDTITNFAKDRALEFRVFDFPKIYGKTIPQLATSKKRRICSVCGLVKRYHFNYIATKEGFDVVVTGHNLDDEITSIAIDNLRWEIKELGRKDGPLMEEWHDRFAKRAKPFALFTDKEIALFASIRKINYYREKCIYHDEHSTRIDLKRVFEEFDRVHPGAKVQYYKNFLKIKDIFVPYLEELPLRECKICGMPTRIGVCAFCRLMDRY